MYVSIDENNFVNGVYNFNCTDIEVYEVEDMEFVEQSTLYKYENGKLVLDQNKKASWDYDQETENLRYRRQTECFDICDRACWYDTLTQEQKEEVKQWRNEWLEVTETRVIPTKPSFIP